MENALLQKVIAISIGLFVAAVMLPVALVTLGNATWTGVDPTVVTIVTILLPVLAVIGIALYFLHET
jgi:hypothetical protein